MFGKAITKKFIWDWRHILCLTLEWLKLTLQKNIHLKNSYVNELKQLPKYNNNTWSAQSSLLFIWRKTYILLNLINSFESHS